MGYVPTGIPLILLLVIVQIFIHVQTTVCHDCTCRHEDGEDQLEPRPLSDGEGSAGSHSQEDTEGEEEEENTLTPPVTTSPGSAVVGVASGSSMAWTRSGANLRSATMLRYVRASSSVYMFPVCTCTLCSLLC